jgi:hypothetical protein
MKLSHENQSKNGRNCSLGVLGGTTFGTGTSVGMTPLMTTGGIVPKATAVPVVEVVAVVDVVDVVVDVSVVAVSGDGPLHPETSAVRTTDRRRTRLVGMAGSFRRRMSGMSTIGVL